MRMQHWATALMSLLGPLVVCSTTFAQPAPAYTPVPGGGFVNSGGYPDPYWAQTPMNPGAFQPQFSSAQALPYSAPGGTVNSLPYPAMGAQLPPNVLQSQTFQMNGNWVNRILQNKRKYYFTTEYLHTDMSGPKGARIGSPITKLDPISHDPFPLDTWTATVPPGLPVGGTTTGGGTGGGSGGGTATTGTSLMWTGPGAWSEIPMRVDLTTEALAPESTLLFPVVRNTGILDNPMSSNGMRFRGGYFNGDGTGWGAEMWWAFTANDQVRFGQDTYNGQPITQNMIAGFDVGGLTTPVDIAGAPGAFLLSMRVGYLPLIDNNPYWNQFGLGLVAGGWAGTLGTGITGSTTRYDLLWQVDSHVNTGGGALNYYLGDVYHRPHASIKTFTGVRYQFIDDRFGFRGLDSGFGYVVDAAGGTGGTGGGTGGGTTFRPTDITGPLYPLFETVVNSTVTSNLAGPEIGLRGDLGEGKGLFSMWWTGSVGALVNAEQSKIQGFGVGNPYYYNSQDPAALGNISPAFDMFANNTNFNSRESQVHLSPMLNLGINCQLNIFDSIPGLRKVSLFDDAKLTFGYNITSIGWVANSAASIQWRGFPEAPRSQIEYHTFNLSQLSVGLQFAR